MTVTIDGKLVTSARRVSWHADDDTRARLTHMMVIGRAEIELEGRDKIDGLLFVSVDQRTYGQRFYGFFEPWSSRWMMVEAI